MTGVLSMVNMKRFFNGRKVLISGHSGFKGSWLTEIMLELNADVIGISMPMDTQPNMNDAINIDKDIKAYYFDIRNREKVIEIVSHEKPELIFHLAAQPIVLESYIRPQYTFDVNVMGTVNILDACKKNDSTVGIVVITTDKVYENKSWIWPYRENDRLGGIDPYAASKVCEEIVSKSYYESFFKKDNIPVSTARSGNVIGGGDWANYRLIPDIIRHIFEGKDLIIRNPNHIRPWQHVLEPLFGYILLMIKMVENHDLAGAWNFGPDTRTFYTVHDILSLISDISKRNIDYKIVPSEMRESRKLILDSTKSSTLLGWKNILDIYKAIKMTYDWYRAFYSNDDVAMLTVEQIREYMRMAKYD